MFEGLSADMILPTATGQTLEELVAATSAQPAPLQPSAGAIASSDGLSVTEQAAVDEDNQLKGVRPRKRSFFAVPSAANTMSSPKKSKGKTGADPTTPKNRAECEPRRAETKRVKATRQQDRHI